MRAPPASPGDRDGAGALFAWAVVALLMAVDAAPYLFTFIEGDFARDLHAALGIVQGRSFPLEGPVISGTAHLGPAWYYALALPMALGGSLTAVVATVAVVSSLQYPLAYLFGREAIDRQSGLTFAIVLALPGVGNLASVWIAHPSVTVTFTLATLLCLWRSHERSSLAWLAAGGAAFGLALHAHPTTLPLAIPLAYVAAEQIRARGASGVAGAAIAIALAAVPFLPLLAGFREHVGDALALSARMSGDVKSLDVASMLTVAWNFTWRVPDLVVGTWVSSDGTPLIVWRAFVVAVAVAAVAGAILGVARGEPRERRRIAVVAAVAFAWLVFVIAIRDVTRFYMLYAVLPMLALLVALGLVGLARHAGTGGATIVRALLAGIVAWSVIVAVARVARAIDDDVRLPPLLGAHVDLRHADSAPYVRLSYLSVRHLDQLGRRLCADGVVHVFGDLAQIVDSQFNVPARIRCGDASRVVIGGTPGAGEHALFLVPRAALEPRAALRDLGGFGVGRVDEVLIGQPSIPLARGEDYPFRRGCGPPSMHAFDVTTRRAATLVIANGLAITCPMRIVSLERDGEPVVVRSAGDVAWTRIPEAQAQWRLVVETAAPQAVQVFAVAPPRAPPGG